MKKNQPLGFSLLLPGLILSSLSARAEIFDLSPYLNQCGGKIYSECDSASLNQGTIFEEAQKMAKEQNKDIFLVVGADWCPACRHFAEMLEKDEDRQLLLNKVVFLELNGDLKSTRALAKKHGFSYFGYPQAFILDGKTSTVKKMFYPGGSKNVKELMAQLDYQVEEVQSIPKPESVGNVSTTTLEADIKLSKAYGSADFYLNADTEAKEFINQGIAAFHLFQYVDAYRSFKKAESLDSKLVMSYVGQIMSILKVSGAEDGEYFVDQSLNKLRDLKSAGGLSWQDQAWLEYGKTYAVSRARSYTMRKGEKIQSLAEAIELIQSYDPENLDGHSLISWDALSLIGADKVKETLKKTISKYPRNVGAHHYMIHLSEFENDIKSAQYHGSILKDLAQGSAHGQHMYGHTLPQTGDWKKALEYFVKAHKIHIQWAKELGVDPSEDWHYSHNLDLMAATQLGLGELQNAANIWLQAAEYDSRAIPHLISALLLSDDRTTTEEFLSYYESFNENWKAYLADYRHEFELTPEKLRKKGAPRIQQDDSDYVKLRKTVEIAFVRNQKLSAGAEQQITKYFASRFQQGGFDGWSNAFLELLRLERVMEILSFDTSSVGQLQSLKFAAQSGSLCGPEKKESLVACEPLADDKPKLK